MGTNSVDFIDQIFNVVDTVLSKWLSYDSVWWKRDSLSVDFTISSLEDEFSDGFSWRISESDVRLNFSEEIWWSFVDSNKGSIVDLSQSEQSQDSNDFWVELVNTSNSDHECEFGLSGYINLSSKFGISSGIDFSSNYFLVVCFMFLCTFDCLSSLCFVSLSSFGSQLLKSSSVFTVSLFFLSLCFGFRRDNFFTCHFYHNMNNYTNNVRFIN